MSNIVDLRGCAIRKVDACLTSPWKGVSWMQTSSKKKSAENINITSPHASEYRHEVRIKVERLTSTHQNSLGLTLVFVLDDFLYTDGFSHASLYNMWLFKVCVHVCVCVSEIGGIRASNPLQSPLRYVGTSTCCITTDLHWTPQQVWRLSCVF